VIRFDEQVVLVTGAGRGLGRAYARLFAARGAALLVHDAGVALDGSSSDPGVADAVVDELRAGGARAEASYDDLGTRAGCMATVEAAVDRLGRVDALVHSAGLALRAPGKDVDESLWRRSMAVNLESAFWLAQAAFPTMRRQAYGRIVLTVSGHGLRRRLRRRSKDARAAPARPSSRRSTPSPRPVPGRNHEGPTAPLAAPSRGRAGCARASVVSPLDP
jgi:NAD(P)-dependent dehydrogenase (short-subunit alcohol dehydrogenase family)